MDKRSEIADALLNIGAEFGFDNISVKALCEKCNISRNTFYYYFDNVPDVIEWFIQDKMMKLVEDAKTNEGPKEGITNFAKGMVEGFPELHTLLDSKYYRQVENILFSIGSMCTEKLFDLKCKDIPISNNDKKFFVSFIAAGCNNYVIEKAYETLPIEDFAENLSEIIESRVNELKEKNK